MLKFFLLLHRNICCGYSLETPILEASDGCLHPMFFVSHMFFFFFFVFFCFYVFFCVFFFSLTKTIEKKAIDKGVREICIQRKPDMPVYLSNLIWAIATRLLNWSGPENLPFQLLCVFIVLKGHSL